MPDDVLERAADAIKTRIVEIEDEQKRLRRALASLSGERRGPGRPTKKSHRSQAEPTRKSNRKPRRAKRGQRESQLLSSIQRNPSFKPAEHAREIGISANQIYGLTAKMTAAGKIKKSESGFLEAI